MTWLARGLITRWQVRQRDETDLPGTREQCCATKDSGQQSWVARGRRSHVLVFDLLLFAVQWATRRASPTTSASLTGWVIFLSVLAIVLLAIAGFRWLRSQLLWRLRNRLIVTYVFIGVIPVFLLVVISLITLYLFSGTIRQFRCGLPTSQTHLPNARRRPTGR